jgi:hypothetical protein
MYEGRDELLALAHETISIVLSYNVSKEEAYLYITNQVELMKSSYELQCCIYDIDPITYFRECDKITKKGTWKV